MSKYVGDSEKHVKNIFKQAKKHPRAIIFIDEIDSLVSKWSDNDNESSTRVKTQFLIELDGMVNNSNILLLGATNMPWALDAAMLRRLQRKIYIPLPEEETRVYMFT